MSPRVRRLLTAALVTVVALYVGLCAVVFAAQRSLLFPAPKQLVRAEDLQKVELPGGTFMLTRLVPGDGPVVLHFHGNAEQVGNLEWLAQQWAGLGCSFVAVEYPGYPGTTGSPSEDALTAAGEAALAQLTGPMKVDRARLVLFGQSVGTGLAVKLAAQGWGTKLVLLSPYTQLPDVAARVLPWLPVRLLMRDRFDSLSRASGVKVPTLVVHGTQDEVIPFDLGQQLARAIPGAKLVAPEGRRHNDLWEDEAVQDAVFSFVAEP